MRYHNITKDDMLNGDGLRVVLWVAGCDHGCKGCQNPVTWDPNGGLVLMRLQSRKFLSKWRRATLRGLLFPAETLCIGEMWKKLRLLQRN